MRRTGWIVAAALLGAVAARGEEKKEAKKPSPPEIKVAAPLAVAPGGEHKVILRGNGLADATAIGLLAGPSGASIQIKSKAKSPPPAMFKAEAMGDSQIEAILKLPATMPAGKLELAVTAPAGQSKGASVLVDPGLLEEKEPNNAFRAPQELALGKMISGTIQDAGDVDVYRVKGKAGEKLAIEVKAASLGSPLDSLVTVYDSAGHLLKGVDDSPASTDSALHVQLPSEGSCLVCITDANDRGHATCAYLLTVRPE